MPRWSERRGVTLELQGGPAQHFVRLSWMERSGLVGGWFNVREARAEGRRDDPETLRRLGGGRALSWRWLRETEARRLYDQRLHALQSLGYRPLAELAALPRGRWDWLQRLIHRGLPSASPEAGEPGSTAADAPEGLEAVLGKLDPTLGSVSLAPVARFLGWALADVLRPRAELVRAVSPEHLAVLLPFLVHHARPELREVGERWLDCPPTLYQLAPAALLRWLESEPQLAARLAGRLEREGLALLGPDRLEALGRHGHAAVRRPAQMWAQRISHPW